jgi:putative nucleotidyltransferase with HDIG domain
MAAGKSSASRRLFVWGETPEKRRSVETRLARTQWWLTPVLHEGEELVNTIKAHQPEGIIFSFNNLDLMLEVLRLMEGQVPECCRFVVCPRQHQAAFHSWEGIPPSILKEDDGPEAWNEKLQRALLLNRWLMNPQFRAVLPHIRKIPSLPESHRRIVEVLRDPYFHVDQVASLISQDVTLTVQLLKLVNSAALGLAQPVRSVSAAVRVIGVSRVQALVMSAWAFFFNSDKVCRGFSPETEWKHALAVAEAAQQLARERRAGAALAEEAFTAGILHDVGKVLQAANSPDAYSVVLADARKKNRPVWEVEKEYLGYTHAELGGCILGMWGLALPVVEAVAWHHQATPGPAAAPTVRSLVYEANRKVRELQKPVERAGIAVPCGVNEVLVSVQRKPALA